jgi:hypothetical protein
MGRQSSPDRFSENALIHALWRSTNTASPIATRTSSSRFGILLALRRGMDGEPGLDMVSRLPAQRMLQICPAAARC